jgi:hypothetical protein
MSDIRTAPRFGRRLLVSEIDSVADTTGTEIVVDSDPGDGYEYPSYDR